MSERKSETWEYHRGLDYAVVMLPGECTDVASISIHADAEDADRLGALIAAAPETAAERDRLKESNAELLAACKGIVASFHESVKTDLEIGNFPQLAAVVAAIAKAETP